MCERYPVFVLIVTMLFMLSDAVKASQPTDQAGAHDRATQITITGRVIDLNDKPVEDAKVTLYQLAYMYAETLSLPTIKIIQEKNAGPDGGFSITVPQHGDSYGPNYIVARKEGFALGWAMQMRTDRAYDIVLGEPRGLAGDVVDEKGQPISDAEVGIAFIMMGGGEDWRILELPSFLNTKTDKNGHFLFVDMPAEATCELRVRKAGRVTVDTLTQRTFGDSSSGLNIAETANGEIRLQFSPDQAGIKLTLPPEARVEGMAVEKTSGRPIAGVKVIAGADQMEDGFLPPDPVTTAEDGTFRIGGLAAGRRTVQLAMTIGQAAEWAAEPVEVDLKADEMKSGIRLELTKGGVIEVLVKDTSGKPIAGAGLNVRRVQRDQCYSGRTDKNGLARIRVPSSEYRVSEPIQIGYALQRREQQVTLEEGETKRVEFILNAAPWGRARGVPGTP